MNFDQKKVRESKTRQIFEFQKVFDKISSKYNALIFYSRKPDEKLVNSQRVKFGFTKVAKT